MRRQFFSISISLALHLGAIAALLFIQFAKPKVPFGFRVGGNPTIVELGDAPMTPVAQPKPVIAPRPPSENDVAVKKKEAEPAAPQPAQASNFGVEGGNATSGPLGDPNGDKSASERERYLYELRILLEGRKVYPSAARRMGETGKVGLRFFVLRDGTIVDAQVITPSTSQRLNAAALQIVKDLKKYRTFPEGLNTERLMVETVIDYKL